MSTYSSRTAEFAADVAELLGVYRANGFDVASRRCAAIGAARGLTDSQLLTLADGFRRRAILGL